MTAWVGLTGGIASGKTQAAAYLHGLGAPEIDADAMGHMLTQCNGLALPLLQQAFGAEIIDVSGSLNRPYVRQRIVNDPVFRRQLEGVLHPMILQEITMRQQQYDGEAVYGLVTVPLLAETPSFQALIDRVLLISAPVEVRVQRLQARNQYAFTEASALAALQASEEMRLAIADDVVDNSGSLTQLHHQLESLHHHYLEIFA